VEDEATLFIDCRERIKARAREGNLFFEGVRRRRRFIACAAYTNVPLKWIFPTQSRQGKKVASAWKKDYVRLVCGALQDLLISTHGIQNRLGVLGGDEEEDAGGTGGLAVALFPVEEGGGADAKRGRKLRLAKVEPGADSGDGFGVDVIDTGGGFFVSA
jgi:hypothetical protein